MNHGGHGRHLWIFWVLAFLTLTYLTAQETATVSVPSDMVDAYKEAQALFSKSADQTRAYSVVVQFTQGRIVEWCRKQGGKVPDQSGMNCVEKPVPKGKEKDIPVPPPPTPSNNPTQ